MPFKLEISPRVQKMIDDNVVAYQNFAVVHYNNPELALVGMKAYYGRIIKQRMERMRKITGDNDKKKAILAYVSMKEHIIDFC